MGMLIQIIVTVIIIVLGKWKLYKKFLVLVGILKFELTLYCYHEFCFDKYWSICCYSYIKQTKRNEHGKLLARI
jgi:hypothetical protein